MVNYSDKSYSFCTNFQHILYFHITAQYLTLAFAFEYQANYLAAEMVAGAAQEAEQAVGIEAMGRKAEQEATQRAAAAAGGGNGSGNGVDNDGSNGNSRAGLGASKGAGGGEGKAQGQKRKFVPASTN